MSHRIAIYNNGQGTTGSLLPALRNAFGEDGVDIAMINRNHIDDGILQSAETRIFILPGIAGETSNYTDELEDHALKSIFDFVSQGGVILSICAGSYFFSRQTIYNPPWGPGKCRVSSSPLFNGVARGPVLTYAREPGAEPRFGHVTVVPVDYKTRNGEWRKAHVCYGNGPGLYPDAAEQASIEILARFNNTGITPEPVALLHRSIGKGALYMSCILPEIGHQAIASAHGLESACTLMMELEPYERERHDLWNMLTTRMKQDAGFKL